MKKSTLLFLCASLLAAPPAPKRAHIRIPAWIEANAGAQPDGPPPAFEAKLDGQPARVLAVRRPADDLLLLLVLDLTGDFFLAQSAKEALAGEVYNLPGCVRAGMLRAQDGLRVLVPTIASSFHLPGVNETVLAHVDSLRDTRNRRAHSGRSSRAVAAENAAAALFAVVGLHYIHATQIGQLSVTPNPN